MLSLWSDADARAAVERWAPLVGEDVALRVYTSRLLGRAPSLVLHGGGNTSVKSSVTEITGDVTEALFVKGSGWDLATIEPAGFPACRLPRLRRAAALGAMTDEQMVAELRGQMLDPSSPTPSVEALLHAILAAKYVDHTHADAVLAIVDQADSARLVAECWEGRALLVPYVMPGFDLARAVHAVLPALATHDLMILDKHGIFTWGESARESYERMIDHVSRAERFVAARRVPRVTVSAGADASGTVSAGAGAGDALARLAPLVRGAVAACDPTRGDLRPIVATTEHADLLALFAGGGERAWLAAGPITPDHVIRTKPLPMVLAADATAEAVAATTAAFGAQYMAYVERSARARGREVKPLDRAPRVVLVPGAGALCLGATAADACIVRDLVEHTAGVVADAEAVGAFRPVGEADLFDVEYWSLEQAKLGKPSASAPLARRIALVTGAAGGIGRATAARLLDDGAHVLLVDRDAESLASACEQLGARARARVASHVADLASPDAGAGAVAACVRAFGGLDLLVSNAGTAPTGRLHEAEGEARLEESLRVNLLAHQWIARASVAVMAAQGLGGCLLFNASKSAFNQGPDFGPYAVAKAALVALMRQYAVDLGPLGIRANAINADRIRTGLFGGGVLEVRAKARGVSVDDYFRANLLDRETTADDVARAFAWLATAEATTGCVVTVDGGNAAAFPR